MAGINNINFNDYLNDEFTSHKNNTNSFIDNLSYDDNVLDKIEKIPKDKVKNPKELDSYTFDEILDTSNLKQKFHEKIPSNVSNSNSNSTLNCPKELDDYTFDEIVNKSNLIPKFHKKIPNNVTNSNSTLNDISNFNNECNNYINSQKINSSCKINSLKPSNQSKDINFYIHSKINNSILSNVIDNLNDISNTYKGIAQSIEYFIHSLEKSSNNILRSEIEEAYRLVINLIENLYNIISLQLNTNYFFTKSEYTKIKVNDKIIYTTPIIKIFYSNNIIYFNITDNNVNYEYNIGENNQECNDVEYYINYCLENSKYIYEYFCNRFNKISILINYFKIQNF